MGQKRPKRLTFLERKAKFWIFGIFVCGNSKPSNGNIIVQEIYWCICAGAYVCGCAHPDICGASINWRDRASPRGS